MSGIFFKIVWLIRIYLFKSSQNFYNYQKSLMSYRYLTDAIKVCIIYFLMFLMFITCFCIKFKEFLMPEFKYFMHGSLGKLRVFHIVSLTMFESPVLNPTQNLPIDCIILPTISAPNLLPLLLILQ